MSVGCTLCICLKVSYFVFCKHFFHFKKHLNDTHETSLVHTDHLVNQLIIILIITMCTIIS